MSPARDTLGPVTIERTLDQEIHDLEKRLLHPEVRSSPREVATLLDEDFIEFGKSGRIYDKQSAVAGLRAEATGGGEPSSRALTDFRARVLAPDVILVTYLMTEREDAQQLPVESLRSSIWRLRGNRWQLAFHQGTVRTGVGRSTETE